MEIKREITFLWALLFLTILLQLATSNQVPFSAALLYTGAVLATFRLYFHYASRPAIQCSIARLQLYSGCATGRSCLNAPRPKLVERPGRQARP